MEICLDPHSFRALSLGRGCEESLPPFLRRSCLCPTHELPLMVCWLSSVGNYHARFSGGREAVTPLAYPPLDQIAHDN